MLRECSYNDCFPKPINSNKKLSDLVKEESINICENKIWSSFLCILALASVTFSKINYHYPDIGSIRYQTYQYSLSCDAFSLESPKCQ